MKIVFVVTFLGVVGAKIDLRKTRSSIYTPANALSWVDEYYDRSYAVGEPYSFSYDVDDGYNNNYGHQQASDGTVTTGSYRVLLPDGRTQIVNFRADKNGYVAHVTYEVSIYKPSPSKAPASSSWPAGGWTAFKPAGKKFKSSYKADLISAFGLKTKDPQATVHPSKTYKTPTTTQYRKAFANNRPSPWTAFKVTEAPFHEAKAVYEAVTEAHPIPDESASSNEESNTLDDVTIPPPTFAAPSSQTYHRASGDSSQVQTSALASSSSELSFSTTFAPIYGTRVDETAVRPVWTALQVETTTEANNPPPPRATATPWTAFRHQWPLYPTDAEYVAPTTYKPSAIAYTFAVGNRPAASTTDDVIEIAKLPTPLIFRTRKVKV